MSEVKAVQKIFSLVLLSIYSLIIAHNVVPHSHDFSELDGELNELVHHNHNHHSHGHDGAHAHHDDHGEDWLSFFIDLFEGLEHSNLESGQFEDYVITKARFKDDFSITEGVDFDPVIESVIASHHLDIDGPVYNTESPPIPIEQLRVCSDPVRGPPSLS